LNIQVGDSLYMDDKDNIVAVENWTSVLKRYENFCWTKGIKPVDITSFTD
jgi:hypothetical protein